MLIAAEEATMFIDLHKRLLAFASGRLEEFNGALNVEEIGLVNVEARARCRDLLLDNIHIVDEFVESNPDRLGTDRLQIVSSWKRFVRGRFIVERDLKRYTVFVTAGGPPAAYGVLGLTTEIVEMIPLPPPAYVEAVLLPWKDRIVCDGMLRFVNIIFGGGMRASMRDAYREAKARGIITCLDPELAPAVEQPKSTKREPKTAPIVRLLRRKLPETVSAFKQQFGEPRLEMEGEAAIEHSLWSVDGTPVIKADCLLVYANIIRNQVLYVYGWGDRVRYIGVVDRTDWYREDLRPAPGQHLLR